jgi:hypothetical protein
MRRFNSLNHVGQLIGRSKWDMLWKVQRRGAECFGYVRILGTRGEPCFDNVLEIMYEGVTKALSKHGGFEVALACDRECGHDQVCVYIAVLVVEVSIMLVVRLFECIPTVEARSYLDQEGRYCQMLLARRGLEAGGLRRWLGTLG